MKKKIIAFTVADANNLKYYESLKNSLRKFHSEEELPLLLIDDDRILRYDDQMFFFRATPLVAKDLIKEYDLVIKIDADSIITGPLNQIWEDADYDIAVVNNSNPREFKAFPYQFLNIAPFAYVNCGLVAMRNEQLITFWDNICHSSLFNGTQMKEQDWLNVLALSNNYKVKKLDEGDSFWGLASKGYWPNVILEGSNLVLNPQDDNWPDKKKIIKVVHFAGGTDPTKGNLKNRFQDDVVKRLEELIKPNE